VESLPFASEILESGELVGVETSATFRTNIVLANAADSARVVLVRDFDAAGRPLRDQVITVAPNAVVILPVTTNASRVHVEGGVLAYASVIDNTNGDPMLIPMQ
jgi:hypothetical protein